LTRSARDGTKQEVRDRALAKRVPSKNIMTIRPIVTFPDPRLRAVAAPVTVFDAALRELAADLLDTMHAASGIGITAPHIGVPKRLVVLDLPAEGGVRTYVNPQIVWASDALIRYSEGSISLPGVTAEIERPAQIRVSYQDLGGAEQSEEASGLLAVCHQHEVDQLDGIFWIQKLSPLKRDRAIKRYRNLQRLP
jgi:peptide deformylase